MRDLRRHRCSGARGSRYLLLSMPTVAFDALDYRADQTFAKARYRFEGDEQRGWRVERDGRTALELGPGYRLLRSRQCGVCSTDLARHHLPFPLPQVIGHEVIAADESGQRFVVEINASHAARGVASDCPFCSAGLPTHCPDRVTLGIHDLPGGFGPWLLAPVAACIPVPANVPDSAAVLVEPLAAALHAVANIAPKAGERIAVLGPRRLGMLVVAALAAVRQASSAKFAIAAVVRDAALLPLAQSFGATELHRLDAAALAGAFDVVIDTTGSPAGLATAIELARREVHLKSTHGQEAAGVRHLTELVVDEIAIDRLADGPPGTTAWERGAQRRPQVAWLAASSPPAWLAVRAAVHRGDAATLVQHMVKLAPGLPRYDAAVVDAAEGVATAIRPQPGDERALVRPRGSILLSAAAVASPSPLLAAIAGRGLRLSSSRCGDFHAALRLLASDPELVRVGERLVTHRFGAADLAHAFAVAGSRGCIKAVVEHREVAR
jgi:threonine dehydrogenase-like Zn-dependent dehydrogenase